ncbi:Phenazine biosynthesis protein PhzF family [Neorhizobium galegae bv. officinalis]|uniref:Phenazine biosynthesis protein PhzF family n=1 Tax=Neorhizobium galegae bv. officinalis TaxID=323656 RepID=A0A0T7FJB4_NEOGA|nr:PhzF family phenazine biosynthesis protein [Neorhizobium galegae]CDZ35081.1 Phenazine biosynthesis protein PhzF family [Neorhizobium galegae bv. officinalis]
MPTTDFVTVDVFTTERFAGNPLAVVPDARGLTDRQMQKIAVEFGYAESTFVLPPENPENSARVRIFTPTMEIPFAGHPNVGTAYVLGQQCELFGRPVADTFRFEEIAGLVEIRLLRETAGVIGATIRAPRPLEIGAEIELGLIADCISIDAKHVRTTAHRPVFASVGLAFAIAELDDLEALAAARPNITAFHKAAAKHQGADGDFPIFLYVRSREEPWNLRARMFAPLDDMMEDPATGSASAALSAFLVTHAPETDAKVHLTIEQGVEMGRRSIIELDVVKAAGTVTDVTITGRCVPVMRGSIDV